MRLSCHAVGGHNLLTKMIDLRNLGRRTMRYTTSTFAVLLITLSGCAAGSQASKQAGEGAKYGAIGGAVAGAVGSLIWGGNPLEGAIAGGVTGAASGAAIGAASGSAADKQAKQRETLTAAAEAKQAEIRQRIGDKNYATAMLLTQCRHRDAIKSAEDTLASTQVPDERTYALMIESVAAEESGDKELAASLYPKIVQQDPNRGTVDKVRADVLEGVMKVQSIRRDFGLPPLCSA